MIKKIILMLLCVTFSASMYAQEKTLNQHEGTFEEALQKVKSTRIPLFIAAGVPRVEACNYTLSVLLEDSRVIEFLNDNFIVYFIQAYEKDQELDAKYGLGIFPYFLIIDSSGEIVHRFGNTIDKINESDFISITDFLNQIKLGLNSVNSSSALAKRYKEGERDADFMALYLNSLYNSFLMQDCRNIFPDYFNSLTNKQKLSPECFSLMKKIVDTPFDPSYEFLLTNRRKFNSKNGKEAINTYIASVACNYCERVYTGFDANYSKESIDKLRTIIENNKIDNTLDLLTTLNLMYLREKGDYSAMVDVISDVFKQKEHTRFISRILIITSNAIKHKGDDNVKNKLASLYKQYEDSDRPIYEITRNGIFVESE